tara:strand:- start:12393 stop:13772 length:1380 start_codon:yes stop_codon:yes gene_type:complete
MENNQNRICYRMTDDEKKEYKISKLPFCRFQIRIDDEFITGFKELFSEYVFDTCKKADSDRDKTIKYQWNILPYDNKKSKDMVAHHIVIACNRDLENEVKTLLNSFGDATKYKKNSRGGSLTWTTNINFNTKPYRGEWVSIMNDRKITFPICIVTYDRAENDRGLTHLLLSKMKINHYLFVEPAEVEKYDKWINKTYGKIIVGNRDYSITDKMGSTPMRNQILDWGLSQGFERVWMLDDNIKGYTRLYQGVKNNILSGEIFSSVESYISMYDNVGVVSHNFNPLIMEGDCRAIFCKNGKCYSSMLIKTDPELRFGYRHQEDNMMSIHSVLKGYCNLCFNHIMYDKNTSGETKGGNQKDIYKSDKSVGNTDGAGYKERYEDFIKYIYDEFSEIPIFKPGKSYKTFVTRDNRMKSHQYHAKVNYEHLLNHNTNDIIKRPNIVGEKSVPMILKPKPTKPTIT